jgi:UDP-2-acetamido-3-amino-2,3-dideoxy-glucuronate N-acetyltransferase
MKDLFVHSSAIIDSPCAIGDGTKIWHFCHFMSHCTVGSNCSFGQNVFVASGVVIGSNVRVQNNVSIFKGVYIEDDVFIGPSVVFTNVNSPRAHIDQKSNYLPTIIKKGASIGANSTIICGSTIGSYSFIGAGSVVTKDVPDYAMVYGNPALQAGFVCKCGQRLNRQTQSCSVCGVSLKNFSEN